MEFPNKKTQSMQTNCSSTSGSSRVLSGEHIQDVNIQMLMLGKTEMNREN